ncbi:MAG: tRNA lysidine(34) synthetase TilS [Ruminococcaceae bacterium]|nr:tRNA lysidine(34) synthetase TilS [Oscillospiraceae bacterium]
MSHMLNKICKTIEKHSMLLSGDSVLVALSGGADSVCLLKLLCEIRQKYNLSLYAAHLNHMIRGADADRDEQFAKELCRKLGVPFYAEKADAIKYAEENFLSTEEAGRILRYDFFGRICRENSILKIATAHNLNDNAETVLMRFIRGTGIDGLCGIPYVNGRIIRPLLDISRQEIEAFLCEKKQKFVTDKTNGEAIYFRNKIRLNLIPEIEKEYNPNFTETISSNILFYNEAAEFLDCAARQKYERLIKREKNYAFIELSELKKEKDFIISKAIAYALSETESDKQITSKLIGEICEIAKTGKGAVQFSKDVYVCAMYDRLYFLAKKETKPFCVEINNFEKIYIKECDKTITFTKTQKKEKNKNAIYVDSDKLLGKKIIVRNRKDKDMFIPSGMKGRKKLNDFLIDKKIPFFIRDEIPVFLADDEIFCIGTMRESENYRAGCNTLNLLKIEISDGGR